MKVHGEFVSALIRTLRASIRRQLRLRTAIYARQQEQAAEQIAFDRTFSEEHSALRIL